MANSFFLERHRLAVNRFSGYNRRVQPSPGKIKPSAHTPALTRYLYMTAALSGAAILIVEILGAKMLAPYFGTSHFVWTAQIAVTLISLSGGYWLGGWMADRSNDLSKYYYCIAGAGVYLMAVIPLIRPVSLACLDARLALGSILAALFLFLIPLTLLAITGPYLTRVLIRQIEHAGGLVGRLSAISTIGSVAGTLMIGYLLIPLASNSTILFMVSLVLLLLPATYFGVWRRRGLKALCLPALLATGAGYFGTTQSHEIELPGFQEIARVNSNFGLMQVVENPERNLRYYLNDYLLQNTYDTELGKSASLFTHMLHGLSQAYVQDLERVLCIGMGIGIVPREFAAEGVDVDVVEINPGIISLSQQYFELDTNRFNIHVGDGRHFLYKQEQAIYDAVILDAFLGDSSPSHLMTREAFSEMKEVLKPDGVLVINSFGSFQPGRDFMATSLRKTLLAVFDEVRIHAAGNGNVFFVAGASPLEPFREPDFAAAHPSVMGSMRRAWASTLRPDPESGVVLTDNYNPVEFRDAANREEMRFSLAQMMNPR